MNWEQKAQATFNRLVSSGKTFAADDLTEIVGYPDRTHAANGMNSKIGSFFRKAHHKGIIEQVGFRKSRAPQRKGCIIIEWRKTT